MNADERGFNLVNLANLVILLDIYSQKCVLTEVCSVSILLLNSPWR